MGSASRSALAVARGVLDAQQQEGLGNELLEAATQLAASTGLVAALTDPAATAESKQELVSKVFAQAGEGTRQVLLSAAGERWSHSDEFIAGVEELGVRAEAQSSPNLDEELLAMESVISDNHELELSLGSKLGEASAKVKAVETLFSGKVSPAAVAVLAHVVSQPRGRRVGRVLRDFAGIVADQSGALLATVSVAKPLDEARLARLQELLGSQVGRAVKLTTVIDPSLVGGVRIQVGDHVIDGSVKARLDDLRLQLAR